MRAEGRGGLARALPSSNSTSSIAPIDWTSRIVDARKASLASMTVSVGQGRSTASTSRISRSRVIEARMCSSSGGVHSAPSASTQNSDDVGASSTRPCGVTSSASSKPRSWASRVVSMFAAYESDLTPSSTRVGA